MELRGLWKIAKRRWWLIALPALAALGYALYGYLSHPPSGGYTTSIRFTAAQPPDGETIGYEDKSYYPWLASEYIVNALTDWVKTGSFADALSEQLAAQGVEISGRQLQGAIASDNERSVMMLYLSWGDAGQLASIAEAATVVLQERSGEFFPQLGQEGLAVIALDDAVITPTAPSLTAQLNPLIRFGLGLAAGVALAAVVEYLDPSVRDRTEVEAMGLRILAEVPRGRK